MMSAIHFEPFPAIETEHLILRRITKADAAAILFLRSDEGMMKYIDMPWFTTEDEAIGLIEKMDNLLEQQEGINWAITVKGDDALIGRICLFNFVKQHYRGELGYMLFPAYQGRVSYRRLSDRYWLLPSTS